MLLVVSLVFISVFFDDNRSQYFLYVCILLLQLEVLVVLKFAQFHLLYFIAQRYAARCWLVGNVREDIIYKVLYVLMTLFTLFKSFLLRLLFTQFTDIISDNTLQMAAFSTTVLNCHQFQLFVSVLLKCIHSSAVNTTVNSTYQCSLVFSDSSQNKLPVQASLKR